MEYQNKLSKLRHLMLKVQGQSLQQVLLRHAARCAEGSTFGNVHTSEEIFGELKELIYKGTNELSPEESFNIVTDAVLLSDYKKDLVDTPVEPFRWDETLFVLLENLDDKEKKQMEPILQNEWNYLQNCKNYGGADQTEYGLSGTISALVIPMVRRIYDNFAIRNLVGIQPMNGPVGIVYGLEYRFEDTETGEMLTREEIAALPPSDSLEGARKMSLNVVTHNVEAGSRKLKACWTMELAQDLNSMYGLDIQSEMIQAMSAEIRTEFTNEVLHDLKKIAGDAEVVKLEGDKEEQLTLLGCRIRANCSDIARTTRRGAGNFIVVSLAMSEALKEAKYADFKPNDDNKFRMSEMLEVGTMNETIRIFAADVPDDEILIGYKGTNGETDTGYFHCPYVPLMSGGVVLNPKTFEPRLPFMTRYGKCVIDNAPDYYRNIKVESNLLVTKQK